MPISFLVIGDPHFKVSNVRETDAMTAAILQTVSERRPRIIVVLGDVLDRHESIHVSPLNRAVKFLTALMEYAPVYVLIGNHDLKNNRQYLSDEHPFVAMKYYNRPGESRMTIVDTTLLATIDGQRFVFVPYVPPGRLLEALNLCPEWPTATAIFCHQELKGVPMGAIISVEGDEWVLTAPYIVCGHVHDYCELQPNVLYTGTPIQHGYGDRNDKTISFFGFASPSERTHERIDLHVMRKSIVRLTCAEISGYIPPDNADLKIKISGTAGELKAVKNHPNIEAWKKLGHKIAYADVPTEKSTIPITPNVRFTSVFFQRLDEPRLQTLFTKLFGALRIESGLGDNRTIQLN